MKDLWFIFLIGIGLACIKFTYLLIKKYKINRFHTNIQFSKILQTFSNKNFQTQMTYARGNKKMSIFEEVKKASKPCKLNF